MSSWERSMLSPSQGSVALSLLPWGPWWQCPARLAGGSCGAAAGWLGRSCVGVGHEESPWGLPACLGAALISVLGFSPHHITVMPCPATSFLPAWLPCQALSWAFPYGLWASTGPHATSPVWVHQGWGSAALLPDTWTLGKCWLTYTHFHASKGDHMELLFSQDCPLLTTTRCFRPIPLTLQIWVKVCITKMWLKSNVQGKCHLMFVS